MASTIKMRGEDKKRLDQLRAKLLLAGIKMNQEDLLNKLLDLGENYLLDIDMIPMNKLSKSRKEEILTRGYDMGVTSEKTVDKDIYGE